MEIYDCKVLIGGSRDNEAWKRSIPAAEVLVLRHIHGDDHVINVQHVGTSQLGSKEVRELLALTYAADADPKNSVLTAVFGPPGVPLPLAVEGIPLREKKKQIPPGEVKRWRDMKQEDDNQPVLEEPAFAD